MRNFQMELTILEHLPLWLLSFSIFLKALQAPSAHFILPALGRARGYAFTGSISICCFRWRVAMVS
jgi:hypothetical protein